MNTHNGSFGGNNLAKVSATFGGALSRPSALAWLTLVGGLVAACNGSSFTEAMQDTDGGDGSTNIIVVGGGGDAGSGDGAEAASSSEDDASDSGDSRDASTDGEGSAPALEAAPPVCDPTLDPQKEHCFVGDAYAIFVAQNGSAANSGTAEAPVDTLTTALAKAKAGGKHVIIVCAGAYTGALAIDSSFGALNIYGGYSCPAGPDAGAADAAAGWEWTRAATTINSGSFTPALSVKGDSNALRIADLTLTAENATGTDSTGAGNSSIAGWIAQSTSVTLLRVSLIAHDGAPGSKGGMYVSNWFPGSLDGNSVPWQGTAGPAISCACRDGTKSIGAAGEATQDYVGFASSGYSSPAASPEPPYNGQGGDEVFCMVNMCNDVNNGGPGAPGATPTNGGSGATVSGALTSFGWTPAHGAAGPAGNPGQGGGGGGNNLCSVGNPFGGAGGACGGCGGAGGLPGNGGGSSIALAIYDSIVDIRASTLSTTNGGDGGSGSVGEAGQEGGIGGGVPYGVYSCVGGNGGPGSGGAGGGGGGGGSSIGLAWTGTPAITIDGALIASDMTTAAFFNHGSTGRGGAAGSGGPAVSASTGFATGNAGRAGTNGTDGLLYAVKQF